MLSNAIVERLDRARLAMGYLSIAQTMALADQGNVILDPFSTLISHHITIGTDNIFHPNTRITTHSPNLLSVGNGNLFQGAVTITAQNGLIQIGDENIFGAGNIFVETHQTDAPITIGANGRFKGFIDISGRCDLGNGCQVLGNISLRDVRLQGGGSYQHPVADERGAVLKGHGRAVDIALKTGQVIAGDGSFAITGMRMQSHYHPDAR
ncbi:hypothetical protein ACQ0MK_20810 [Thalassospira lucentensis]|uniref:hypothetical protein n=1 Tax=Thalassospira lucentensis TaxID=168935 RepID=UPI003D2ECD89